jgi:hypothetical protein
MKISDEWLFIYMIVLNFIFMFTAGFISGMFYAFG